MGHDIIVSNVKGFFDDKVMKKINIVDFYNIVKENVKCDGKYCNMEILNDEVKDICLYKNGEWCNLFNDITGYDYKKERAVRVKECIKYFPKIEIEKKFGGWYLCPDCSIPVANGCICKTCGRFNKKNR